ncbi:MAG: 50S ribosomal protein L22 [Candidatus Omnitrophica bacterium]|nr:50S ribosomal protein L22 [Candidatus Omnitrophota bacterium]
MLVAKASTKYIRVSPRKIRLVIDLIRGETATRGLAILSQVNKRTKIFVEKTLRSAISNAAQNPAINPEQLVIAKITADQGPTLKRYRAAAMGRATMIRHRTTHLQIELVGQQMDVVAKPKKKTTSLKRK